MKFFKKLNLIEWSIILITSFINIFLMINDPVSNYIGLIASITGVICVVLTAKGHIACYIFGTINILAYIYISFEAKYFGELMLNGIYYLPMQFYGMKMWKQNLSEQNNIVKGKIMSKSLFAKWAIISVLGVIILTGILNYLNGNLPILDSMSTIFSLVAMWLSIKMFKEQWILWIIIDVITVIMWVYAFIKGEPNSMAMVIMWIAYLINAFYGYLNWTKLEKQSKGAI